MTRIHKLPSSPLVLLLFVLLLFHHLHHYHPLILSSMFDEQTGSNDGAFKDIGSGPSGKGKGKADGVDGHNRGRQSTFLQAQSRGDGGG